MIWCKCVRKIRDKNNIIERYEIADINGEHMVVTKEQLKNAMINKQVSLINLKLTKDNKIIDMSTEEQAKLMRYLNQDKITEQDNKTYIKAKMLGTAPEIDEYNAVSNLNIGSKVIAITPNIERIRIAEASRDTTLIFYGSNFVKVDNALITAGKVIIKNPTMITYLSNNAIEADSITLDYDEMDIKILDIIFKMLKEDFNSYGPRGNYIDIIIAEGRLDRVETYKKVVSILKRQKPSSKLDRRCYDIIAYLRLIYSIYISFGDREILSLAKEYINEFTCNFDEYIHARLYYNKLTNHGQFIRNNSNCTDKLIKNISED